MEVGSERRQISVELKVEWTINYNLMIYVRHVHTLVNAEVVSVVKVT